MANKQSKPDVTAGTVTTQADLLEELRTEVLKDAGIAVETNTKVEDRTDNPVDDAELSYDSTDEDLGNGFILTTYGEAVA